MPRWLTVVAAACAAAALPFAGPLFAGQVLYFRDVGVTYYPDLVFVSRALAGGVWPLWHPGADAGAPFLAAYPVHLLLAALAGPRAALALSPPLHLLVAMIGTVLLARRLGTSPKGSLVSGLVFGLSGLMLGGVLYPVFLAAAWAPLAIALVLALDAPRPWPRAAALAVVLALQASTLGVEALPQTAIFALLLLGRSRDDRRRLSALVAALVVAALLAAPALLGSLALLADSARGRGFVPEVALGYSAPPAVLAEAALPRFLGDTHTFGDLGFWGQPFFPGGGGPFFLSLYLGPVVLLLAALAGRREWRLWTLVAGGVLLALGAHGPLGRGLALVMGPMRAPVKFFLLSTLALALLCGRGLDRAAEGRARRWPVVVPGLLLLALALAAARWPGAIGDLLGRLFPAASPALARDVVARLWPAELAGTGAAALGAGLALARGGRVAVLAGVLAVVDLLRVNGGLNPAAPADFYELREGMREAVASARSEGRYRWFSYGAANARALRFRSDVVRTNSDLWLYLVDRQALVPRTQVIDRLEGAFDMDRMGLAPAGATVDVSEMQATGYGRLHPRLWLANVRWVLSFDPIEDARLTLRRAVDMPEVVEPLRLYEVRNPLPRAFFAPRCEVESRPESRRRRLESAAFDPREVVLLDSEPAAAAEPPKPGAGEADPSPSSPASVSYELLDPHTVRVTAETPRGYLVVLDGYHPDWSARDESGAVVPVLRADGRYRALPTPGGRHVFTLRYEPKWRGLALAALGLGLLAVGGLVLAGGVSEFTASRGTERATLRGSGGQ